MGFPKLGSFRNSAFSDAKSGTQAKARRADMFVETRHQKISELRQERHDQEMPERAAPTGLENHLGPGNYKHVAPTELIPRCPMSKSFGHFSRGMVKVIVSHYRYFLSRKRPQKNSKNKGKMRILTTD